MRGALLSAALVATVSAVIAFPHPQQAVALPPHLLRQYLAQGQQQRLRQPEATPIYEQESQSNAQPQYVQREQAQPQAPPQYVQQYQPQPEYRPKAQRPRPQPVAQQVQQDVENENPEDYEPTPSYQFGFDVNDDQFTNYQNRKEESQGGVIKGSYSVVDSDGFIRTVTYTADPKEGFKAEVVRKPTDIVVKVPTPAPPSQASHRHQPEQYLDSSSRVESRPQQQQYHRYQ